MPKTPADTREEMSSPTLNPQIASGSVVTLTLAFDSPVDPVEIFDAFANHFGEGNVRAETDTVSANGGYNFRVTAP